MPTPQISVIIPAYNAARTVGVAIDSVLAQTFTDFELIVVDDGSQDATAEVVAARDDHRVTLIRTDNAGVAAARNVGLDRTVGSYVAFLDADDVWQPEKLERQHGALTEAPDAGACFASAQTVDDELRPTGLDPAVSRNDFTEALLLEGNVVAGGGSSLMARAALIDDAGRFDPRLSQCADWDMWLRMSSMTQFIPIEEPLVLYRSVPGTMSSNPELLERDTFALLDKFYAGPHAAAYDALRRRAYAAQWMVCAGTYLHAGRMRDSLRCVAAGLRSDPRTVKRLGTFPARRAARLRQSVRTRSRRRS